MERTPNLEQLSVINELEQNIILYASAGTGKTFSVANRINNILKKDLAKPSEILCLTFTVKACNEMMEDISEYAGKAAQDVNIRTIHSFCLYMLQTEARKNNDRYGAINVCDDTDEVQLLKSIILSKGYRYQIEDVLKESSFAKDLEDLYSKDVVFLPQTGLRYWKGTIDGMPSYLSQYGQLLSQEEMAELSSQPFGSKSLFRCPRCQNIIENAGSSICPYCGADLRQELAQYWTGIVENRPEQLQNISRVIKEARFTNGFYSDNLREDYAETINCLKETEEFEKVFAFRDPNNSYQLTADEELKELFIKYGDRLMEEYESYLQASNLMDFDDMIVEAARMLQDEETAAYWQKQYRYIVIDEMQDVSTVEYRALRNLFGTNNVMMCGDYFQTIYKWRGSDPETILADFTKQFHASVYMLRENYRSTRKLSEASFGYLKNTYSNLIGEYCPSDLVIHNADPGSNIVVAGFDSLESEARSIYSMLKKLPKEALDSVCIMGRSNYLISNLARAMDKLNDRYPTGEWLDFFTVEKDHTFYKSPAVKDFMAFIRILCNPDDNVSMERIAKNFINGVGEKSIQKIRNYNNAGGTVCSFLNKDTYLHDDPYYSLLNAFEAGNVVVYNVETTGLDTGRDEAVHISAARLNASGEVEDVFDEIVIPTVEMAKGAREAIPFDIDAAVRERGIPAAEALNRFAAFVKNAVIVGHNSSRFDSILLRRQMKDLGLEPLDAAGEYDTLTIAKTFCTKQPDYKLSTLCSAFEIADEDAQNASDGISATAKVLTYLIKNYISEKQPERSAILKSYKARFTEFFDFYENLKALMESGNLEQLANEIITTMDLETKYDSSVSASAVKDVQAMFADLHVDNGFSFLNEFVQNASLSGSQIDGLVKKLKKIPIITIHQSKGCEFDTVILADAHEGGFPSKKGLIDEEQRLFYVAISRPKKRLLITYVKTPSRFIEKIPEEFVDEYIEQNGKVFKKQ